VRIPHRVFSVYCTGGLAGGRGSETVALMKDDHAIRDLLPAYALGSLDTDDAAQVRGHIARCRACREELAAYAEVTGRLALTVPEQDPPPWLESRIMEKVLSRQRGMSGAFRVRHPALAAIAAVLIIALGTGNILLLARPFRAKTQVTGLITVALAGTPEARDAYGTIVLDLDDNRGVLAVRGLAPLSAERQYQLWLIRDGERASGGVFAVTADGYGSMQISVPAGFTGFTRFGISIEPAGGSLAPTGPRVMSGTI
jgi:anti-sigma-K factor RskA